MRYPRWIVAACFLSSVGGGPFALGQVSVPRSSYGEAIFTIHTGTYGPKAEVRVARPTFRWEIWANDPRAEVSHVSLTVDGQSTAAAYDPTVRAVLYRPDKPLAGGPHHVECHITFNNGMHFDKAWDTRVAATAMQTLPAPSPEQLEALAAVNKLRNRYHLPPAKLDDSLDIAALAHSEYLSVNKTTGHDELPGSPGFVGATGTDRVGAYGWTGTTWEVVAFGAKSSQESIENLFDAPYHRVPFLQAGTPFIGAGFVNDRFTLEFESTPDTGTSISPPDGATGIPCAWHDYERPNPVRLYGDGTSVTGYPVVIAHFAPGLPRLTKIFGWLSGPDKRDIPCWINTPLNDDILRCAAILIPKAPLRPNTVYHAGFDGRDETGATVRQEVTFTTGA